MLEQSLGFRYYGVDFLHLRWALFSSWVWPLYCCYVDGHVELTQTMDTKCYVFSKQHFRLSKAISVHCNQITIIADISTFFLSFPISQKFSVLYFEHIASYKVFVWWDFALCKKWLRMKGALHSLCECAKLRGDFVGGWGFAWRLHRWSFTMILWYWIMALLQTLTTDQSL